MAELSPSVDDASIDRFCVGCGYNLRGLMSDRCPECGLKLDEAAAAPIPWEARRHLGAFRAFWRTAILATFRPKKLAAAAAMPVDDSQARKFARIVAIVAAIPPGIFLIYLIATNEVANLFSGPWPGLPATQNLGHFWEAAILWAAGATCFIGLPIGLWVMALLGHRAVRVGLRLIEPASIRRDRAAVVSRYLCAPLVWIFIPTLLLAGSYAAWDENNQSVWRFCIADNLLAALILLAIAGLIFWNSLRLISAATHCGRPRLMAGGAVVASFWIFSAFVGLGLVPMIPGLILLMTDSLRQ